MNLDESDNKSMHNSLGLNGWPLWLVGEEGVDSIILKALREVQEYGCPDDFFAIAKLKDELDALEQMPDSEERSIFLDRTFQIIGNHSVFEKKNELCLEALKLRKDTICMVECGFGELSGVDHTEEFLRHYNANKKS
jgi:hypothetical protein